MNEKVETIQKKRSLEIFQKIEKLNPPFPAEILEKNLKEISKLLKFEIPKQFYRKFQKQNH